MISEVKRGAYGLPCGVGCALLPSVLVIWRGGGGGQLAVRVTGHDSGGVPDMDWPCWLREVN